MPAQIKRLLILTFVLVAAFLLFRSLMIPDTFGQYGHYRGASLDEIKALDVKYLGEAACLDCHEEYGDMKGEDLHAEISCESCHGPGWKHVEEPAPENIVVPSGREFCALCHEENAARSNRAVAQISLNEHNPDNSCVECHNPHAPWQ